MIVLRAFAMALTLTLMLLAYYASVDPMLGAAF